MGDLKKLYNIATFELGAHCESYCDEEISRNEHFKPNKRFIFDMSIIYLCCLRPFDVEHPEQQTSLFYIFIIPNLLYWGPQFGVQQIRMTLNENMDSYHTLIQERHLSSYLLTCHVNSSCSTRKENLSEVT